MQSIFRSLFTARCPQCKEALLAQQDSLSVLKYCSQGHYKEETYTTLGVRIIYDLK